MNFISYERVLKEANEKEARYFRVNEHYATRFIVPITNKFYARHEAFDLNKADPAIVKRVTTYLDETAKEKYEWPITENQCYGWFSQPLTPEFRSDERFFFPQKNTAVTKAVIRIQQDKTMAQPKFVGIPWKF